MEYCNPYPSQRETPVFLKVLCILTFVGSGLNFLLHFMLIFAHEMVGTMGGEILSANPMLASMPDGYVEQASAMYAAIAVIPGWQFALMAVAYLLAIVGAAFMLKLNKTGFHLYILSQIATFCVGTFVLDGMFKVGAQGVCLSIIFIVLYGIHYKYMKKQDAELNQGEES
ncbi:MAG: hypothetical protein LBR51_05445 [Bacteroidales bacterium]|jgi:hypothetical protein|nr:hypothetical protein [Bacteroidales bacterium]